MVDIKLSISIITLKVNTPIESNNNNTKISKLIEGGGGGGRGEGGGRRRKRRQYMLTVYVASNISMQKS